MRLTNLGVLEISIWEYSCAIQLARLAQTKIQTDAPPAIQTLLHPQARVVVMIAII